MHRGVRGLIMNKLKQVSSIILHEHVLNSLRYSLHFIYIKNHRKTEALLTDLNVEMKSIER